MKAVAEEIRRIRADLGLTQEQFCDLFNLSEPPAGTLTQGALSLYESGAQTPLADKLLKIQALGQKGPPS